MPARTSTTSACLLLALLTLGGCTNLDNCPDGGADVTVQREGTTDIATLTYVSSPWGGPLDPYPPNTFMRFVHDLGFAPSVIQPWVAFASNGTADEGEGDVTLSAGNQSRVQCVDARQIVIENDTCEEDFYIRVVAVAYGNESTAILCDEENR